MTKEKLFKSLSSKDKCKLFVGKNFWEMEAIDGKNIFLSDGPHGIRKEIFDEKNKPHTVEAICYPAACLSACSFNKKLFNRYGQELAKECIKNDIDILLGPGINIKRNPLCGRNFEYFSEDPYLSGKLAASYINGVQCRNVGVSLKHFALNSQEYARFINDSIADERAMREIYLKGFEIAIKEAHPWTIMCSYNLVNGVHSTENRWLMHDVARKEFGFDGAFISDWGAMLDPVASIKAGLDLEMPGISKGSETRIFNAIENKELDMDILDESSKRKIELYEKCSQEKIDDFDKDYALMIAKIINDESIVLLKNEDKLLPLSKTDKVAFIGDFVKHPRIQGGGSSQINAINVTNVFDVLTNYDIKFDYARGYNGESLKANDKLISEAVDIARGKDKVIIMCGLPRIIESEGYDRKDLKLPIGQLELIDAIYQVNKNIIVILSNGAPVEMPFIAKSKGLIEAYLGGSMQGESLVDILYGKVNPSGRLAESFPMQYEDVITKDDYLKDPYYSLYKESIYVGYRYYDTFKKKMLFPFGYGLSYSDITYAPLKVEDMGNSYLCHIKVSNHSNIACKEVIQLYVGQLNPTVYKAKKELKAFEKITLDAHQSKDIDIEIEKESLKYFSPRYHKWMLESGIYRFYLAKHVSDESNYIDINISSRDEKEDHRILLPNYYTLNENITNEEFEYLLEKSLILKHKVKPFSVETPIKELSKTCLGFVVFNVAKVLLTKGLNKNDKKMYLNCIPYQPIRSLQMVAPLSKDYIDGIVDIFNHHPIIGYRKMKQK